MYESVAHTQEACFMPISNQVLCSWLGNRYGMSKAALEQLILIL